MKKRLLWTAVAAVILAIAAMGISGNYMLDYSLSPAPERADTALYYAQLYEQYPATRPWVDSLRRIGALRDTFVTMPTGERHHALYVRNGGQRTAVVLHGWRRCGIDVLFLAQMYEHDMGYNVVVPDLHAHGLSEGDAIGMGWHDRLDVLHWMDIFHTDTMVVHGISMGGATTMMVAGEAPPKEVKHLYFVDDCGYTDVWEEFEGELDKQFGLPPFPVMYVANLLCQWRFGWRFDEASPIHQISHATAPMMFIHGDTDDFVPTEMVHRLYAAKPEPKTLWMTKNTSHAESYKNHEKEYTQHIRAFLK